MSRTARMLRKQNNEFEEKLTEQNQDVMTDIVAYLRGAKITETEHEQIRADISQMLFEAQQRGETAEQVVGMDYKQFCDEILENVEPMTGKESSALVQYILHHSFEEENRTQKLKLFFAIFVSFSVLAVCRVFLKNILLVASIVAYLIVYVITMAGYWMLDRLEA